MVTTVILRQGDCSEQGLAVASKGFYISANLLNLAMCLARLRPQFLGLSVVKAGGGGNVHSKVWTCYERVER